jgi:hypothetical protein
MKGIEPSSKIFFIGHSAGSYFLNDIARKYGDGFIQMGNVLNSNGALPWNKFSLEAYPIPTLTLVGKKDGYISHLYTLDELLDISNRTDLMKPVIIESNVNHLQMADGKKTTFASYLNKYDIESPITLHQAHEQLTTSICEFIKCSFDRNYTSGTIEKKTKRTKQYLMDYLSINEDLNNTICKIQNDILLSESDDYKILNTIHKTREAFILSKPRKSDETIYTDTYYGKNPDYYSHYVCLKLKNSETNKSLTTARNINKEIFDNISKEIQLNDVNVVFEEDERCNHGSFSGINWILSIPKIRYDSEIKTLHIKSPVLITNATNPGKYSYMYYMKILSPKLCFELIQLYLT